MTRLGTGEAKDGVIWEARIVTVPLVEFSLRWGFMYDLGVHFGSRFPGGLSLVFHWFFGALRRHLYSVMLVLFCCRYRT
jgi:hypothetical protein